MGAQATQLQRLLLPTHHQPFQQSAFISQKALDFCTAASLGEMSAALESVGGGVGFVKDAPTLPPSDF